MNSHMDTQGTNGTDMSENLRKFHQHSVNVSSIQKASEPGHKRSKSQNSQYPTHKRSSSNMQVSAHGKISEEGHADVEKYVCLVKF